jgi:TolB-like protein
MLLLALARAAFAADVLAVAYFDAHSIRPELEPLGRGVADMLTTDLGSAPPLRVVERMRIAEVLAELKLQSSDFVDPATAQTLGRGVGATVVVVGSITVAIEGMRIDARLVDVATGEVRGTAQATGKEDQFFALENEVARELLAGLGVAAKLDDAALPLDQIVAGSKAIDAADAAVMERLRAIGEYKTQRLSREAMTYTTGTGTNGNVQIQSGVTWVVYQGGNTALTARQFAERIGDDATYEKIDTTSKTGRAAAYTMWGVGAAAAVGGLAAMLVPTFNLSDRGEFDSTPLYVGLGATLGGLTLASLSGIPAAAVRKEGWVGNYYSVEDTDARIQTYNRGLATRLGVSEKDALAFEVQK